MSVYLFKRKNKVNLAPAEEDVESITISSDVATNMEDDDCDLCSECGCVHDDDYGCDCDCDCSDKEFELNFREVNQDMLTLPVYYHLAHCIPCDLSMGGQTARRINQYFGCVDYIRDMGITPEVGDAILHQNVFTMFPVQKKYQKMTLDNVLECVRNMTHYCINERIKFIAMPHIGCGQGGLSEDWFNVREAILNTIEEVITNDNEAMYDGYSPLVTFCSL